MNRIDFRTGFSYSNSDDGGGTIVIGLVKFPFEVCFHVEIRTRFVALPAIFHSSAQQGRGTILGHVTDSSGAAMVGAKVAVTNVDTNTSVTTVTNGEGFYTTPPVNVGSYEIVVEHGGFKKEIRSGIRLQVDQKPKSTFNCRWARSANPCR